MHRRSRGWRRTGWLLILSAVAATALAACGSSSSSSSASASAPTLLKQTFSGGHSVKSGVLDLDLSLTPTGSSTLTSPITFAIHGPFQSRGSGNLPASDFTITGSAEGHNGSFGVVSTGTAGYVTLQGTSYQLPAAQFQKLESSFSSAGSGSSAGGPGLSELGINPLDWVKNPSIVGTESVGGTDTTHIRGSVDVAVLLSDLNKFLAKESKNSATAGKIPTTIPAATQQKIAAEIKDATLDVWTGNGDKTLRKLTLKMDVPVTGRISTLAGGLSSAAISLTLQYSDLNQPQTISAPTNVKPYSQFATKLQSLAGVLEGSLGGAGLGGATGSAGSSSGSGSTPAPSTSAPSSSVSKYSTCIQQSGGDVSKMQKCASLLKGGQ
jgi:hypothetical protein